MWRSAGVSTATVKCGTDMANLNMTFNDTATDRHDVAITGLTAFTKYYYAIYDGNTLLEGGDAEHWFRTFPNAGEVAPFRVWAIGDFGKGNTKQAAVRDAYLNFSDTTETNLWIWLGDNVYNDGLDSEYVTKDFDSVYGYSKVMKHLPFLPAPGNHDYNSVSPVTNPKPPLQHTGPYYDIVDVYKNGEAGGVATGHELFYSYDYRNAHFISLNSEVGAVLNTNPADDWTGANPFQTFTSSPMTDWLTQDLQANTKPWVIVYFHQPPYTDGSHESTAFYEVYMKAMREHFAPIFEQYGVDLVVCGHTHVYERSYLVRGSYGDPADITPFNILENRSGNDAQGQAYVKYTQGPEANYGTVYVNNGNSGSSETSPGFNHPYMYAEYGCDTCCGSFVIDIDGNKLNGRHIDMHGTERDNFTIYKVNSVNGINDVTADNVSNLKVTPNPFKNTTQLTFDLKHTAQVNLQLTDVAGKVINVYNGTLNQGKQTLAIDAAQLQLASGVYVVRLNTNGKISAKSVIKID